jgi:hypothetical protein
MEQAVAHTLPPAFPHRPNKDGTFDSICSHCFATVALGLNTEAQLGEFEERHVCHTDFLAERGVQYDNVKQSAKILYQRMDEHLKRPGERADLDDAIAS